MTRTHLAVAALVSASACSMNLNGKPVSFGSSSGGPTSSGATSSGTASSGAAADSQSTGHYKDYPRYPEAPADPWQAVAGDQPKRGPADWRVRASKFACTAVHDHCLDPITWFFETDATRDGVAASRRAVPGAFLPDGVKGPSNTRNGAFILNEDNGYTAYRTVPATKRNLVPGALAIALAPPDHTPPDGGEVYGMIWWIGVVHHVDWEINKVFLVGNELESIPIQGARVAVLSWRKGERVTILGGKKRDALAVMATEVILPEPTP